MNTVCRFILVLLGSAIVMTGSAAYAHPPISVESPWIRSTIGNNMNTAAYVTLINNTAHDTRLISASWAPNSAVSSMVQLHRSQKVDGNWTMQHQKNGILIPAGKSVVLKPRDYHIMLMGLSAPIKATRQYTLRLSFDTVPSISVTFDAREAQQ